MEIKYRHLSEADRVNIDTMRSKGHSPSEIALAIGFDRSTIYRELKRSAHKVCTRYFSVFGQRHYCAGRKKAGLSRRKLTCDTHSPMWQTVIAGRKR